MGEVPAGHMEGYVIRQRVMGIRQILVTRSGEQTQEKNKVDHSSEQTP